MIFYDIGHSHLLNRELDSPLEGKTKPSVPQSGEDFLAGVPESEKSLSGTPLSISPHQNLLKPSVDVTLMGPCDLACGTCADCRAYDALKALAV